MASNLDLFNRRIDYLRVSVTDRCNLRCLYCHPVKDFKPLEHSQILTYEEILRIVSAAGRIGISKIRITGGEPLVRRKLTRFISALCRISGIEDVSLTTNGVLLAEKAKESFDAGVRRINVSMDTLSRLKYARITGRDCFDRVWSGIREAETLGFFPIKLNVVVIRGLNDDELLSLAGLSLKKPYRIRFIEYMPVGPLSGWRADRFYSCDEMRERLESLGPLRQIPRSEHDGPAERYRFESAAGEIGFISPLSHNFCGTCNRLRLTADGRLRPCLLGDEETDIKSAVRQCSDDELLERRLQEAIFRKPAGHRVGAVNGGKCGRPMVAIGG